MSTVPTVEVVHADGFCIINESDFDSQVHTRYKRGTDRVDPIGPPDDGLAEQVVKVRVAEAVQMIAASEDRPALEYLAEHAERKTIRRAASRRLEALG